MILANPLMQDRMHRAPSAVLKLVYKREFFDFSVMKPGGRLVVTVNNDGRIVFKEYSPESRKAQSIYKAKCSLEEYEMLCAKIKECIETADQLDSYCDNSSEQLKIYHQLGRIQIVDRGLGNGEVYIKDIMREFLDRAKNRS